MMKARVKVPKPRLECELVFFCGTWVVLIRAEYCPALSVSQVGLIFCTLSPKVRSGT